MKKSGQIQLSFSVIFSVIIIVVTLGVAGYVISQFWNSSKDVECKLFWQDLQKKIDAAWQADDSVSDIFKEGVSANTQKVCFGYINASANTSSDGEIQDALRNFAGLTDNLMFYPRSACGGKFSYSLKHVKSDSFFCVNVVNKQGSVQVSKGSFDALAKLSPIKSGA